MGPWRVPSALLAAAIAIFAFGCGDDEADPGNARGGQAGSAEVIDVDVGADSGEGQAPDRIGFYVPPQHAEGANFVAQSGCLACHTVGQNGNDGPGPVLTGVGRRLSLLQIERAITRGPGIMPSYSDVSPAEIQAAARFLAVLR